MGFAFDFGVDPAAVLVKAQWSFNGRICGCLLRGDAEMRMVEVDIPAVEQAPYLGEGPGVVQQVDKDLFAPDEIGIE